jgi:hypothetical protein
LSILDVISNAKDNALDNFLCPVIHKLGIQTIPAASLLVGETVLSYMLHYGVILPSPIGVELMEFPAKMAYILKGNSLLSSLFKR